MNNESTEVKFKKGSDFGKDEIIKEQYYNKELKKLYVVTECKYDYNLYCNDKKIKTSDNIVDLLNKIVYEKNND